MSDNHEGGSNSTSKKDNEQCCQSVSILDLERKILKKKDQKL